MKNAIGYVRVYTDNDEAKKLPGAIKQKNEINRYAMENNLFIAHWIVEKIPNENSEAPEWNDLIYKKTKYKNISLVIVYKSSLLRTDSRYYLYYLFALKRRNISLVSIKNDYVKENRINDRDKDIIEFCAGLDNKRYGIVLQDGRKKKTLQGEYAGGRCPYGYKIEYGKLVIKKDEAEVIKLIFTMREKKKLSMNKIAKYLNDNNILTKMGKTWTVIGIQNIIKNKKIYQGYRRIGKTDNYVRGEHDAII